MILIELFWLLKSWFPTLYGFIILTATNTIVSLLSNDCRVLLRYPPSVLNQSPAIMWGFNPVRDTLFDRLNFDCGTHFDCIYESCLVVLHGVWKQLTDLENLCMPTLATSHSQNTPRAYGMAFLTLCLIDCLYLTHIQNFIPPFITSYARREKF